MCSINILIGVTVPFEKRREEKLCIKIANTVSLKLIIREFFKCVTVTMKD